MERSGPAGGQCLATPVLKKIHALSSPLPCRQHMVGEIKHAGG